MANKVLLKKSSIVTDGVPKAPTPEDLEYGELAINYAAGKLYFKKADNTIDAFSSAGATSTVSSVDGNIGDVTAQQLLDAVKKVDGTGSGLDSDLLDGLDSTSYAKSGANTDITSLSGVTGAISTADYIDFDSTATVTPQTGRIWWDGADDQKTLSVGMADGVVQQVGQETYFRIKATAPITNGQVVMFTGTVGASGALTGAPATGLTPETGVYVMGVATQDIPLNGWGYVTNFGLVRGINTTGGGEGWTDGTILYYNPQVTGGLTSTIPTAPNPKVMMAAVVNAASNGSIFVRINHGSVLGGTDGNVEFGTLANGNLIAYNGTLGRWENVTQSTITSGDSDKLDGQHGSYYLDWVNTTGKPTTLSGYGITDAQPLDGDLTSIAGLTGTSGLLKKTAANTWSLDTTAYTTNTGTVTSVSGTGTVSGLSLSGTITTSGNITLSGTLSVEASNFASQTANTFLAAPNDSAGVPTFRTLVASDVPILNQNTTGSAATLTTARTLTIGSTGKTFNGSANVSWSLAEIGAAASSHTHDYLPLAGGTLTGGLNVSSGALQQGGNQVLHAGNYTSYAPTLTGSGASGTWGINVTGTASNVTGTVAIANGGTGQTTKREAFDALAPTTTKGDLIVSNGADNVRVGVGTDNYVLTADSTTAAGVKWAAAGATLSGQTDAASPYETSLGYQAGNVSTGIHNTFIGYQAGLANTTGVFNVAVGSAALDANTTGERNTAVGYSALSSNTGGIRNTAMGEQALSNNSTGGYNVGIGQAALVSNTTGSNNVAIGASALVVNTTGTDNVAVGYNALYSNTTGYSNTAIGSEVGYNNTTGYQNIWVGRQAGYQNTSGTNNVGIGFLSLFANTTGTNNTAVGYRALDANTIGNYNVAMGSGALGSNTLASSNCAFGYDALAANTTGGDNVAFGYTALDANTTGEYNVAIGTAALGSNTTGTNNTAVGRISLAANSTGSYNVGIGSAALGANTTGSDNVAVGFQAMDANTTGRFNTAVGSNSLGANTNGQFNAAFGGSALSLNTTGGNNAAFGSGAAGANTTGQNNVAFGYQAFSGNSTGNANTAVGHYALGSNDGTANNVAVGNNAGRAVTSGAQNTILGGAAAYSGTNDLTTGSNNTIIGYNAAASSATVSNEITLGNSSIATLRCQVTTITSLSDARDKANISDLPAGLTFVKALRPVEFDWNMRDGGKVGEHDTGFIAQDLKAAQESTGVNIPGLVYESNPDRLEAGYGKLIPVLVKAIQELSAEVESLKSQLKGN